MRMGESWGNYCSRFDDVVRFLSNVADKHWNDILMRFASTTYSQDVSRYADPSRSMVLMNFSFLFSRTIGKRSETHGNALAIFWQCFGNVLVRFWQCVGNILAMQWQYFGRMILTCGIG